MEEYLGRGLRVLYAVQSFPHLTQTYILTEIEAMRRFGVHVEVWSSRPPLIPYETDIPVHCGSFDEAVEMSRPHLIHTHWTHMAKKFRDAVKKNRLPLTVRGHHVYDFTPKMRDFLQSDSVVARVYIYEYFASKLPKKFTKFYPVDACFDPYLYYPADEKDRRLVLRVAPARTVKELDFFMRVATQCPEHRFILVAGTTAERDCPYRLMEYNRKLGEPIDLRIDISHRDVAALMRTAGIYMYTVRPSEEYSMPISVSEALGSGCYVLNRESERARLHQAGAGDFYVDENSAACLIKETLHWSEE